MEFRTRKGKKIIIEPVYSVIDEDVTLNLSPFYSYSKKNASVNAALGGAVVGGDAKVNVGGLVAVVGGDAKVNVGGLGAVVDGDAKVNVGGLVAGVGGLKDYTVGDIFPRFTKYFPSWIREINLPAFNFGAYTNTERVSNGVILGGWNNVNDDGKGDYISLGLMNRVTTSDGRNRYVPLFAGRVSFDGIFSHNYPKDGGLKEESAQIAQKSQEKAEDSLK